MKINAVGVTSTNLKQTVKFYQLLGFEFGSFSSEEQHLEAIVPPGSSRLMIDSKSMVKDILGKDPRPGNHSTFAIEYDHPDDVNQIARKIKQAKFTVIKEPWDAFWGQRYCIVSDPDGYLIDIYAKLPK